MRKINHLMSRAKAYVVWIVTGLLCATAALVPARAAEPAQDEALAYTVGVQTYINGFPMMDLYRTLWETSFDPKRGHDRTVNERMTGSSRPITTPSTRGPFLTCARNP